MWNLKHGTTQYILCGKLAGISRLVISPNSFLLAAAGATSVELWDRLTLAPCRSFGSLSGRVRAIAFSNNSNVLGYTTDDGKISLWDTLHGAAVPAMGSHNISVAALAFPTVGLPLAPRCAASAAQYWEVKIEHDAALLKLSKMHPATLLATLANKYLQAPAKPASAVPDSSGAPNASAPAEEVERFSTRNQWLLYNGRKLLWLPPEYRPSRMAVHENIVALGLASGEVLLLGVDSH
jgi:hypothetical protein